MYGISFHALSDMHTVAIYATRLTFKHILVKMYLSGVFGGLRRIGDIFGLLFLKFTISYRRSNITQL